MDSANNKGLEAIRRQSLYHHIVEQLTRFITDNALKPGVRLPSERDLATTLGVSRNSLREAVRILEMQGMISVKPGLGMHINAVDMRSLETGIVTGLDTDYATLLDLHEVREIMETQAVRLATARATPEALASMQEMVDKTYEKTSKGALAIDEDLEFHLAIVKATGNRVLERTYNTVTDLLFEVRKAGVILKKGENLWVAETHQSILDPMVEGDAEMAVQAMREHLLRVGNDVKRLFNVTGR